ncbi:MAG: ATP-binding protein, partial [Thermoguttaceae bacterium]|nr:ATP-binding protein [Thermoguttaceae bacterium]
FITGELLRELETRIPEHVLGRNLAEELHRICQDLRLQLSALHRTAASLRRVSAAELFAPYPRMARSLAAQLKKKVRVLLQGEDVEIDRALARELEAPLTHLVRNAVDHGIELPVERRNRAVDEIGTIRLSAQQSRHWIRISVEDDGRGIDPIRLRSKAVEKGFLTPQQAQALADSEAIQLIFHPGFSTAEKVSEVSGRGVGMDVVRSVVQKHRGNVEVESHVGMGTKVHLTFPVRQTVLVLDGLLVRRQNHFLVLPLEHVREILQIRPPLLSTVQSRPVLQFRGRCYELFWLEEVLGWHNGQHEHSLSGPAALVGSETHQLCLRFDELLGHRQVVVHCLQEIFPNCTRTQGVALLGGGRLALVLNIPEILAQYRAPQPALGAAESATL